ncbi:MAG: ABC transporter ATP-binding protein [Acidobacteriota bacterium]
MSADAPSTSPAEAEAVIHLEGVSKAFGEQGPGRKVVLDDLHLEVAAAESLVVIGASGTGKSVLLKHIIGLMRPDSGRVLIDGVDLQSLSTREITDFRRRFGMAFQEGALFDSMTVEENIAFPLVRSRRASKREIRQRVQECLELVRLEGTGPRMPAELSGGMRRRVGFARAIALEPRILLFDEPTSGLDPVMTALIDEVILDLKTTLRCTSVTITHDMTSARRVADRIAMLHQGRIIAEGPPRDFDAAADPRVRQFIAGEARGPLTTPH